MTNLVRLTRDEAEFLVDRCEETQIPQWMELAAQIREIFGMSPFPAGAVPRRELSAPCYLLLPDIGFLAKCDSYPACGCGNAERKRRGLARFRGFPPQGRCLLLLANEPYEEVCQQFVYKVHGATLGQLRHNLEAFGKDGGISESELLGMVIWRVKS